MKQFRDLKAVEAVARLQREFKAGRTNLKFLGHGQSGVALTDGETVYKFWFKDSSYEKFVECALAHQSNPFFPKFKSKIKTLPNFIKINTHPGDIRYVKMEMLQPWKLTSDYQIWEDQAVIAKLGADKILNRMRFELMFDAVESGKSLDALLDLCLDNHRKQEGIKFDLKAYRDSVNPDIVELLKSLILIDRALGSSDYFDYQRSNIASRGNQLVILDPVCNDADANISAAVLKLEFIPREKK